MGTKARKMSKAREGDEQRLRATRFGECDSGIIEIHVVVKKGAI